MNDLQKRFLRNAANADNSQTQMRFIELGIVIGHQTSAKIKKASLLIKTTIQTIFALTVFWNNTFESNFRIHG